MLEGLGALGGYARATRSRTSRALARRAAELGAELDFVRRADAPDHVYWAEARGRGLFLRAAPISVAEAMRERLYGAVDTVVFTSATLRAGSSFEYFCRQVGLLDAEGEAVAPLTQLAVPSSFDYATPVGAVPAARCPSRASRASPRRWPRRSPGWSRSRAAARSSSSPRCGTWSGCTRCSRGGCRTRCCCRARRRSRCCSTRSSRTPSVLFASASFWEGVDVPGDALSLVIIDKLPFASPDHPVVAARIEALEEAGREPFSSYQLPEAALALRQGFGRLIRTRTDRGIVALLDVRVGRKAYGRQLLAGLPPARRFKEMVRSPIGSGAGSALETLPGGAQWPVVASPRGVPREVPDTSLCPVGVPDLVVPRRGARPRCAPSRCQTPRCALSRCQTPRYGHP